jgi:hypothetical protein
MARTETESRAPPWLAHLPALGAREEPSICEGLSGQGCACFEQILVLLGDFVRRELGEWLHLGIYTALV